MAHGVSGGGSNNSFQLKEEKITALVVNDVKVRTKTYEVRVPKYIDHEQIKYNTTVENQVRYRTVEKDTLRYVEKKAETTKFNVVEQDTIRFIPVDRKVERPVPIDKPYERPVIVDKEYQIATYGDVAALRELIEILPAVKRELKDLKEELDKLKKYKLVEEVVKVPRLEYYTVKQERIIWKDVPRERCKKCGDIK